VMTASLPMRSGRRDDVRAAAGFLHPSATEKKELTLEEKRRRVSMVSTTGW